MRIKLLVTLLFIIRIIFPKTNSIETNENKTINNLTTEITVIESTIDKQTKITPEEQPIGSIIIPNINLHNKLYNITNKHNNIEENVTILKSTNNPSNKESLIILAAHSGQGKIAYFNDLNKLKLNDEIILHYYNKKYIFTVSNILEQDKNGYIDIQKQDISQLILTTCSTKNKNKQLIIESTLKES